MGTSFNFDPKRFVGLIGLVVIWILAVVFRLPEKISHDPVWLMYVAEQVKSGQVLYSDIVSINLPMSVWLNMPTIWVSEFTGLSAILTFKIFIFAFVLLSLETCRRLIILAKLPHVLFHLVAISFVLLFCPQGDFGQREHIFTILFLPYLYLVLNRNLKLSVPRWLAILVGILAAVGICIKPHFLLFPIFLEVFLLIKLKLKTFHRPELPIMILFGAAYAAYIIVFLPDLVGHVLPLASALYGTAIERSVFLLFQLSQMQWLSIILLCMVLLTFEWTGPESNLLLIFILAILAGLLIYYSQKKGWFYQLIPAVSFSYLGVFSALILIGGGLRPKVRYKLISRFVGLFLIALSLAHFSKPWGQVNYFGENANAWVASLNKHHNDGSVAVLTTKLSDPFPAVYEANLDWGLSVPTLWIVLGVERTRQQLGNSTERLDEIEAYSQNLMIEDFKKSNPKLVYVDERANKPYQEDTILDYIEYYSRQPAFAQIWSEYEKIGSFQGYGIYRHKD